MKIDTIFYDICKELDLGKKIISIEKLTGGYMHKMYYLQTENGQFAIKLLNPSVMKRDDVFENYKLADDLERKLQQANIPIVSSLEFNKRKMQCIDNQYFYIFNFIHGKALKFNEIQKKHCRVIGSILAKIHKIGNNQEIFQRNEINIDWEHYIQLAEDKCPEIISFLADNVELLYDSQQKGNDANKLLPNLTCISNGDMDIKNVLWENNKPYIIDLECLSYGNPFMELFELSLCWSGCEYNCVDYNLLEEFISAYVKEYGKLDVDWTVLYYSNNGRLLWLEYNVKRALLIECEDEEERLLGIEQVKETIEHVIYYDKIREDLLARLESLF